MSNQRELLSNLSFTLLLASLTGQRCMDDRRAFSTWFAQRTQALRQHALHARPYLAHFHPFRHTTPPRTYTAASTDLCL